MSETNFDPGEIGMLVMSVSAIILLNLFVIHAGGIFGIDDEIAGDVPEIEMEEGTTLGLDDAKPEPPGGAQYDGAHTWTNVADGENTDRQSIGGYDGDEIFIEVDPHSSFDGEELSVRFYDDEDNRLWVIGEDDESINVLLVGGDSVTDGYVHLEHNGQEFDYDIDRLSSDHEDGSLTWEVNPRSDGLISSIVYLASLFVWAISYIFDIIVTAIVMILTLFKFALEMSWYMLNAWIVVISNAPALVTMILAIPQVGLLALFFNSIMKIIKAIPTT